MELKKTIYLSALALLTIFWGLYITQDNNKEVKTSVKEKYAGYTLNGMSSEEMKKTYDYQNDDYPFTEKYLGVPLVGRERVSYMGSTFNPTYKNPDGTVSRYDVEPCKMMPTECRVGRFEDMVKTVNSQGTETRENKINSKCSSDEWIRSDTQIVFLYFSGFYFEGDGEKNRDWKKLRAKLGSPVFLDICDLTSVLLFKDKTHEGGQHMDQMIFCFKNQDDVTKFQEFCLANIKHAISNSKLSEYRRGRFMEAFLRLYELSALDDPRLNLLPGRQTRAIMSENEVNDFSGKIKKMFQEQLKNEANAKAIAVETKVARK